MRVALFVTCINDTLQPRVGRAVVTLLERLGVRVGFPRAQSCCGQPQYNTGYRHATEPLVHRYSRAFETYDHVVTPSGSCAAMVRENYPRIGARAAAEGRGRALSEAAARAVPKTYELTEFLVDVLQVTDVGAYYPHTVTYHPTCHGLRVLGLGDRPRRLLEHVRGLELRELPGAEECCGFGGTFAVKNPAVSAAMGADKVRAVRGTGAEAVCTVDSSCLLHLGGLLTRQASAPPVPDRGEHRNSDTGAPARTVPAAAAVRTVHIAEILASTQGAVL
ncbi:(Fe-S)-binding protein [Streptomyces sp. MST-110588]|uniref:(Fe-S)-binding protein n=1 Tax=Streptomyces sp. MST-110588 TaxID=2833628 RepID=UPI001F5DE6C7|nr:(Fe-S)-binding protein [Streptomyces sp. MST-110588]UNO43284.1 (Fe-S)-binding protein [Streptomyces sp. MST-110588]